MRREFLAAQVEKPAASSDRVVDIVWFTGIDVPRFDFWSGEEWILRLPMDRARIDRLNNGAPLMKDHSFNRPVDKQVGVFEKAWIENGIGKATVRFAKTADVDPIWEKVEQGILQNVSMEASIDDFEDVTPRGKKTPKVLQATGWEVEAVAIVPVGADPNAGFMSASPLMPTYRISGMEVVDLEETLRLQVPPDAASVTDKHGVFHPGLILALLRQSAGTH